MLSCFWHPNYFPLMVFHMTVFCLILFFFVWVWDFKIVPSFLKCPLLWLALSLFMQSNSRSILAHPRLGICDNCNFRSLPLLSVSLSRSKAWALLPLLEDQGSLFMSPGYIWAKIMPKSSLSHHHSWLCDVLIAEIA